jgi:hypothetical protein
MRALGLVLAAGLCAAAEEGMWTFDNLPLARMQARYGFAPDQAWLDRVRLSVLRFPGGSGSFVSRDGLVLTNHHVAHAWIERISDAAHDYVKDGFLAQDRTRELPVPGLEVRTLRAMVNVTADLAKAVPASATEAQAAQARKEALARLLQAEENRTGLASEPVTLYQGGETWIYSYRVHTDVRLVMAPEFGIAAFGRDWDNFTFPRHDLDFALFRVYEHGRPYHPRQFLHWARAGLRAGDLTVVAGHPGRTSRLDTLAQMEAARDVLNPLRLRGLDRARKALHAFAAQGPEQARLASPQLLTLENSYKIFQAETEGLKDPVAMARVAQAERDLQARVAQDPGLQADAGQSWDLIRQAVRTGCGFARETAMLDGRGSRALAFALGLVRWKAEAAKPVDQRPVGYRTERDVEKLRGRLTFQDPLPSALEEVLLAQGIEEAVQELGPEHPIVAALLEGRSPADQAKVLAGTALLAPAGRRALLRASPAAVRDSRDPMVVLAWKLDQLARPYREREEAVDAVIQDHGARIARARFALNGKADYPDATFSLRLSYGSVESVPANGTLTQPFTTLGGLYDRADAWGPAAEAHSWELPARWRARRKLLDPSTPLNFISSNDIIGGNSGSPVLDRQGDLVGLVFDGNMGCLPGRFYYDPRFNRAVSVDGRAILAALAQVYDAPGLVRELTGAQTQATPGPAALTSAATNP